MHGVASHKAHLSPLCPSQRRLSSGRRRCRCRSGHPCQPAHCLCLTRLQATPAPECLGLQQSAPECPCHASSRSMQDYLWVWCDRVHSAVHLA